MAFTVKILGSSSAAPAHQRNQSAQLASINGHHYLLDCGEGTQMQLARYKAKKVNIDQIFITHLHGDHCLGLVGLISTMHLLGRKTELNIFAPVGLSEILLTHFRYSETVLNFPLQIHELLAQSAAWIYEDKQIRVKAVPLRHRIPCYGFILEEKPSKPKLDKLKLPQDITLLQIGALLRGEDLHTESGDLLFKNSDLVLPQQAPRSYAYITDTIYDETLILQLKGVNVLYHEATFMHDLVDRAVQTFHTTAKQAAQLAVMAKVEKLIIGHFSIRYTSLEALLDEARAEFQETYLAIEGETFTIRN